jgi:hypothetical protein
MDLVLYLTGYLQEATDCHVARCRAVSRPNPICVSYLLNLVRHENHCSCKQTIRGAVYLRVKGLPENPVAHS